MHAQSFPIDYFCQFPLYPVKTFQQKSNHFRENKPSENWLFYYVDNGQLEIDSDHHPLFLTQSEGVLMEPHTAHSLMTFQDNSASVIRLEFRTHSEEFRVLRNKRLTLSQKTRRLLENILDETKRANAESQSDNLQNITERHLNVRSANYASGPFIRLLIDQLLIELKRSYYSQSSHNNLWLNSSGLLTNWEERVQRDRHYQPLDYPTVANLRTMPQSPKNLEPSNLQLFSRVEVYLKEHIYGKISLDRLVEEFRFSKTHLSHVFKSCSGKTILAYYNDLKVEEAKRLILDTDLNFSQISDRLEFSSIHYFSRLFKKKTGMMPSEYRQTIIK